MVGYDVFCHICGHRWHEQDPNVDFIHGDHVWQCADEAACFQRRAEAHEYIDHGIDQLEQEANQ